MTQGLPQTFRVSALAALVTLATLVPTGCGGEIPSDVLVTLTTGKHLRLRAMHPIQSPDGQRGVVLKYQTELSSDDLESLRDEIQEIWRWFLRPQVERAKLHAARIVATSGRQDGWETTGYEFTMTYLKNAQGNWVRN